MKRNLDLPLKSIEGKPYADKATLKTVLFQAVVSPVEADKTLKVEGKMKLYGLAQEIHKGGIIELTADDIAMLKARVAELFSVLDVGAVVTLLEQDYQPPATEK